MTDSLLALCLQVFLLSSPGTYVLWELLLDKCSVYPFDRALHSFLERKAIRSSSLGLLRVRFKGAPKQNSLWKST